MKFLELAKRRKSIRKYHSDPVAPEQLQAVLEAGRMAPSATNAQPWCFIVVTDEPSRQRVNAAYPRFWFAQAPVVIVICVEPAAAWKRGDGVNYAFVDGAIAADHMTLCAAELGLGTCWVGAFDSALLREALHLPEGIEPVAMLPLGRPAEEGREKTRKPLDAVFCRGSWWKGE